MAEGRAIGQRIGAGRARVVDSIDDMHRVEPGDVLVTDMTDPDWEPIMKRAAAIVTNRGGRTCHAAIIARELGIPAGGRLRRRHRARSARRPEVTVSCAEGDTGYIYDGELEFERQRDQSRIHARAAVQDHDERRQPGPGLRLRPPAQRRRRPGAAGVHHQPDDRNPPEGAARTSTQQAPRPARRRSRERIAGYDDPVQFYVDKLAEGISTLAAAFSPKPVIVRMSDFKSNEYANLIGGSQYEPHEENPMLGFRGASRYISEEFRDCFELECRALKKVRDDMGLDQRLDHDPLRAHLGRRPPGGRTAGERTGSSGARTACS
ncbi:MAG: PEP-utilizing enzyme [Arhodomonas sp.]|nr:PEP-utilizing enzyme [Arhodomonas sp.]